MEDIERSMELLRYQTRLDILFSHLNKNKCTPPQDRRNCCQIRKAHASWYVFVHLCKTVVSVQMAVVCRKCKRWRKEEQLHKSIPETQKVIDGCTSGHKYLKCPGEEEWFEPDVKEGKLWQKRLFMISQHGVGAPKEKQEQGLHWNFFLLFVYFMTPKFSLCSF